MGSLNQFIRIRADYTRSINLQRDMGNLALVQAYLPTAKALQALELVANGLNQDSAERSLALIGPYGSGKSAFALFLSALLADQESELHSHAMKVLKQHQASPPLLSAFTQMERGKHGFLRVMVNGIPTSLSKQLLLAFDQALQEQRFFDKQVYKQVHAAAMSPNHLSMDQVMALIEQVQTAWASAGGVGVLLEIDELGKFLEYEAYHPDNREIHLLQLLAEHAQQAHAAPLHMMVMLHQSFEHYTQRLGKQLRDEWQKIQGRFHTLAFLEPAEQALRVVAAAFDSRCQLPAATLQQLADWVKVLALEGALPLGMQPDQATELFRKCYPLHPLTTLVLPVLCQKVAQNERTLFSYLGSQEPFGLRLRLNQLKMGEWVMPADLYDYFMLNHPGGFSDPLTYQRWLEVVTALERLDAAPHSTMFSLLKTIGLLNLIGNQRGLKASQAILQLAFGKDTEQHLQPLLQQSFVHLRTYNREYRVWQGTDFDLDGHLNRALAEYEGVALADKLNELAPLKPVVARRASIEIGTLRSFIPYFVARTTLHKLKISQQPRIVFYLAEKDETSPTAEEFERYDVVAICPFTERLREAVFKQIALRELPQRHAALQHDPVAQREHRDWLHNAELETGRLLRNLLEAPQDLQWMAEGKRWQIHNRRQLQEQLSRWITRSCYPQAPAIRNELVNWDKPSPSANTGRKRLINAMLSAADQPYLGIDKTPAEMSLYLSLLQATGLHAQKDGRWGLQELRDVSLAVNRDEDGTFKITRTQEATPDPCSLVPMWEHIHKLLRTAGNRQVGIADIYQSLRQPPFGIKLGVLPVFMVAYLLVYRREVALYQEGIFIEQLNEAQAELLCRRPELFALERFEIKGLHSHLFNQYMDSIVGKVSTDATLLDIVKPLVRFISSLPLYTQRCKSLSKEASQVLDAFNRAQSPGVLLFKELPRACGLDPEQLTQGNQVLVETFTTRLVAVLRELKGAYPQLLTHWQERLGQVLLEDTSHSLEELRPLLARRFAGLDKFTPDRMGLGAFIRRLADEGYDSDQAWLESIATLLGQKPPLKWLEENRLQAEMRLMELGQQLRDLEKLRLATAQAANHAQDTVLIKLVDVKRGEISRVVQLSNAQQAQVQQQVGEIAKRLDGLDESQQLAVIATLLGRLSYAESTGETQ